MPGPADNDDAPRWEPPAPSRRVPAPPAGGQRRGPRRGIPRWAPPTAAAPGARPGRAAAVTRREPAKPVSPFAGPFVWWSTHPWIVVWTLVLLVPGAAVALRLVDESEHEALVSPLAWAFVSLFVAALALGALKSARRSPLRLALGLGGSLAAAGLLVWPVMDVTLGRVACPRRAGSDLGTSIATTALEAWSLRNAGGAAWRDGRAAGAWNDRARAYGLLDYQLVDRGCWERVAPVDGARTWHEFRVTVRPRDGETPLSKVVVVHAAAGAEGWRITGIEGPLP